MHYQLDKRGNAVKRGMKGGPTNLVGSMEGGGGEKKETLALMTDRTSEEEREGLSLGG